MNNRATRRAEGRESPLSIDEHKRNVEKYMK
jgi:hypothetical protein